MDSPMYIFEYKYLLKSRGVGGFEGFWGNPGEIPHIGCRILGV